MNVLEKFVIEGEFNMRILWEGKLDKDKYRVTTESMSKDDMNLYYYIELSDPFNNKFWECVTSLNQINRLTSHIFRNYITNPTASS